MKLPLGYGDTHSYLLASWRFALILYITSVGKALRGRRAFVGGGNWQDRRHETRCKRSIFFSACTSITEFQLYARLQVIPDYPGEADGLVLADFYLARPVESQLIAGCLGHSV